MRPLALIVLAVALAGCAKPDAGTFTIDLDAVPPEETLRRVVIPPRFVEERSAPQAGTGGSETGHAIAFAHEGNDSREQLLIGLLVYRSAEAASKGVAELTRSPAGVSGFVPLALGDEAYVERAARTSGRGEGGSEVVVARIDRHLMWVAYDAILTPAVLDAEAMARELASLVQVEGT